MTGPNPLATATASPTLAVEKRCDSDDGKSGAAAIGVAGSAGESRAGWRPAIAQAAAESSDGRDSGHCRRARRGGRDRVQACGRESTGRRKSANQVGEHDGEIVGLGAAAYSPAKYGILTELLPPSQLVKANGWIEGLTIASIILGVLLGGQLVGPRIAPWLLGFDLPGIGTTVDTPPEAAISAIVFLYVVAAIFNLFIPRTDAVLQPLSSNVGELVRDFSQCNARLWADKLGQISLATTTLFWGVSGNLRVIVFAWAAAALGYGTTQASSLVGVVAIGTAVGAVLASWLMRLDRATSVIPLGIAMGLLVIGLNFIRDAWIAAPFLIVLGAIGGFLVVPMNALLQHRGHNLMGAGRSIAVQNFNEQAAILGLGAFYTGMTKFGLSAFGAIAIFGVVVAGTMWWIRRWHQGNCVTHRDEVNRLLAIARSDPH